MEIKENKSRKMNLKKKNIFSDLIEYEANEAWEENALFFECHKSAKKILNDIQESEENKNKLVAEKNNIIAFIGDRGTGKTTTMKTFMKGIKEDEKDYFKFVEIIEPEMFTKNESLLEIVIGKMFKDFSEREDEYKNINIVKNFQSVLENLRIMNIEKKELLKNTDDIDFLIKLSSAISIKKNLKELVKEYLKIFKKKTLVIPIDDLDMNLEVGERLLEDIRRYLVFDNIVIIMSAKFEQLEEIVYQKLFRGLKDEFTMQKALGVEAVKKFNNNIKEQRNNYLEKLIPYSRRVYMPNINDCLTAKLETDLDILKEYNNESLGKAIVCILEKEIGYKIVGENFGQEHLLRIIPHNNLRGLIDFLVMLSQFNQKNRLENVRRVKLYYQKNIEQNVPGEKGSFLKKLLEIKFEDIKRYTARYLLEDLKEKDVLPNSNDVLETFNDILNKNNQIIEDKIDVGILVGIIELYSRAFNEENIFIELLKCILTIRGLENICEKDNKIDSFIGNTISGTYFIVTRNKNKLDTAIKGGRGLDKFIEEVFEGSTEPEKKERFKEWCIKSLRPNEDRRLIERRERSYNKVEDFKNYQNFEVKRLNILLEKKEKLEIINIHNFMMDLDKLDKEIHTIDKEQIDKKICEVFHIDDEVAREFEEFITKIQKYEKRLKDKISVEAEEKIKKIKEEIDKKIKYLKESSKKSQIYDSIGKSGSKIESIWNECNIKNSVINGKIQQIKKIAGNKTRNREENKENMIRMFLELRDEIGNYLKEE